MSLSAKEKLGWKGALRVLRDTRWKKDVKLAFCLCLVTFLLLAWVWNYQWVDLLKSITKALLSIYGGLLGVSIAAYAVVLSMPHMKKIMGVILPGRSCSLYAQTYAQLTLYLILQVFSMLGAFIVSLFFVEPATVEPAIMMRSTGSSGLDSAVNMLALFILLSTFLYQLILIKDTFIMIYNGAIYSEATSCEERS